MKRIITIVVAGVIASGCIGTRVVPLGEAKKLDPRTAPEKIEVYMTPPQTPFAEIGLVQCDGTELSGAMAALDILKEKASELGGDAIIFQPTRREMTFGFLSFIAFPWLGSHKITQAIVLRFNQDRPSTIPVPIRRSAHYHGGK